MWANVKTVWNDYNAPMDRTTRIHLKNRLHDIRDSENPISPDLKELDRPIRGYYSLNNQKGTLRNSKSANYYVVNRTKSASYSGPGHMVRSAPIKKPINLANNEVDKKKSVTKSQSQKLDASSSYLESRHLKKNSKSSVKQSQLDQSASYSLMSHEREESNLSSPMHFLIFT